MQIAPKMCLANINFHEIFDTRSQRAFSATFPGKLGPFVSFGLGQDNISFFPTTSVDSEQQFFQRGNAGLKTSLKIP